MLNYELLDFGKGLKLERFGSHTLMRPETVAGHKKPKQPIYDWKEDSSCRNLGQGHYEWDPKLEPWLVDYDGLQFELRLSQSKNIGIFPEQEPNWQWLQQRVRPGMRILNLFAYTGVATLVCARAGAQVCHVDASKSTVRWASDNARRNGIDSVRWIVEEARVFLKREAKRGNEYEGLILDPPPFGRSEGQEFEFGRDIEELLQDCRQILRPAPALFLMNSYAVGLKAEQLGNLVKRHFKNANIETGELYVGELALSVYARF